MLLVAQCNALSRAMPFLFERIDDESELLLPDNLLRTDSVIRQAGGEIPEEDWAVEIIGWLYQFYISEKKDQVIGKVVKSEDIPAATQLFTPNWIVQYLVQNSVGRLWLMANPKAPWPASGRTTSSPPSRRPKCRPNSMPSSRPAWPRTAAASTPNPSPCWTRPAAAATSWWWPTTCSRPSTWSAATSPGAIPRLILEKNLYGLDIDDRAAQWPALPC
jgi:hypothetical protein